MGTSGFELGAGGGTVVKLGHDCAITRFGLELGVVHLWIRIGFDASVLVKEVEKTLFSLGGSIIISFISLECDRESLAN